MILEIVGVLLYKYNKENCEYLNFLLDQKVTKNQGKNKASRSGFLDVYASFTI
jgi:hypothetical protein